MRLLKKVTSGKGSQQFTCRHDSPACRTREIMGPFVFCLIPSLGGCRGFWTDFIVFV